MFGEIEGTGCDILDERFSRCLIGHARVERLWTGARWSEGPAWFAAGRYLIWSDIPNNRMLRYDDTSGLVSVFREPSNNSNGNTVDGNGRLVTCEHLTRRVTRTEHCGDITVIADRYEGKRFNSPNDVVVSRDGSIWFSDPTYGIDSDYEGDKADPEIGGSHVYRVGPESHEAGQMTTDFVQPNGLAFSSGSEHIVRVGYRQYSRYEWTGSYSSIQCCGRWWPFRRRCLRGMHEWIVRRVPCRRKRSDLGQRRRRRALLRPRRHDDRTYSNSRICCQCFVRRSEAKPLVYLRNKFALCLFACNQRHEFLLT